MKFKYKAAKFGAYFYPVMSAWDCLTTYNSLAKDGINWIAGIDAASAAMMIVLSFIWIPKYMKERKIMKENLLSKDLKTNRTLRLLNGDSCFNCEWIRIKEVEVDNAVIGYVYKCGNKIIENPSGHISNDWRRARDESVAMLIRQRDRIERMLAEDEE